MNKLCPLGVSETKATVGVGYDAMVRSAKMAPCPICKHEIPIATICTNCPFDKCYFDKVEK